MMLSIDKKWVIFLLVVGNPGIFLVDNIHFQYNGFMYGIQLLSITAIFNVNRKLI